MSIDRGRSRTRTGLGAGSIPRRGFTLNGQPILSGVTGSNAQQDEKTAVIKVKEESNAYFFWAIYLALMLIALGNLLTTMVIINVLRIGPEGMEAIEFSTLENAIKFFGNADLGNVYQHNGIISGFAGEELSIIGKESTVTFEAHKDDVSSPKMTLSNEGISIENVHDLNILDPVSGDVVFSTSDPELELPSGVKHLETEETEVDSVVSGLGEDMLIRSDRSLTVRGAEGILIEGKEISMTSAEDISISSIQGGVTLEGGIMLDTVMLPHGGVQGYPGESGQFKLCVCMPSGRLFKVAVPDDNHLRPSIMQVGCHSVMETELDPCSE